MTTVLIILLAYPVANVVLTIIAGGMMSYMLRMEDDFIASLLFGPKTLKFVFYPIWIRSFGAIARLMFATIFAMFAATFRALMEEWYRRRY